MVFWINSHQLPGLLSIACHLISDGLSALLTNNRRTEASAAEISTNGGGGGVVMMLGRFGAAELNRWERRDGGR